MKKSEYLQSSFDLVLFTDHYPYGKSESFLTDELQFLAGTFKRILIVPLDTSGRSTQRVLPDNVEVLDPPFDHFKSKYSLLLKGLFNGSPVIPFLREAFCSKALKSPAGIRNLLTSFLLIRALFSHLRKTFNHGSIDSSTLLYFYWGLRWSQVVPFLPRDSGKILIRMHGSDLYEELNHGYIPFRRQQIESSTAILLISEMSERYFKEKYPWFSKRIILSRLGTHDHGINPAGLAGDPLHLVSCANMVPVKRVHLIARCLKLLRDTPVVWTHFGEGPEIEEINRILINEGQTHKANLAGWISHHDLMRYYATHHIDLFINTSSSEGVPVSLMEALSFGIPVLATNVGGTSEILNEHCGKLLAVDLTPERLASEIHAFLAKSTLPDYRKAARDSWLNTSDCAVLYPKLMTALREVVKES